MDKKQMVISMGLVSSSLPKSEATIPPEKDSFLSLENDSLLLLEDGNLFLV